MLPFRKILFPVDFSEPCRRIAPRVREKLERFEAELILVHALNPMPLAAGPMEAPLFIPPPDQGGVHQLQTERLSEFAAEFFPGAKPTMLVSEGDANPVIMDTLRHHGADLVMLPTHGHGVFHRLLLGSVTAKVLHDVDCAVWTMVLPQADESPYPYRRLLCAMSVDQADSAAILLAASSLANSYQAELSILHAVDLPDAGLEYAYRESILEAADRKLRQLRHDTGVLAAYSLVVGDPVDQTCQAAVKLDADLIVTGRGKAREGASRAWSHLYAIIREAPCPVLSI